MFCYPQITNQQDLWKSEIFGTITADNQVKGNLTTILYICSCWDNWPIKAWYQNCLNWLHHRHASRLRSLPPSPAPYLTCLAPGRAWNNFPAGAGQTYFSLETTCLWPDKCLSPRIIWLHFTVKYMRTIKKYFPTLHTLSWICSDDFIEDKAISF